MGVEVHLVDGTLELFRCFHGAPRATNEAGEEVGAVRGLVATLASLLYRGPATHVAVAFDAMAPPRGAARGEGAAIRSQGLLALRAVRALGIQLWPMTRFQADDALASGAARLDGHPEVDSIVICTTDKDLLQCVHGDRVTLLDRARGRSTGAPELLERFGIRPEQVPAYLALVGDPSDGLPGCPGFGAKSTARVLQAFGTLEAIPDDPDAWPPSIPSRKRLAASLAERRVEITLGRDLSVLRADLPVPCELADLRWRGPTEDLQVLLSELGDPDLAEWVPDRLKKTLDAL